MLYDFGLNPSQFNDEKAVSKLIEHIRETFHVVMFRERFLESLVLLRHALGWPLADVVVFSSNKQTYRNSKHADAISEQTLEGIRQWNKQDLQLYNVLYEQFNKTVVNFGVDRMAEEVKRLKDLTEKTFAGCVERTRYEKHEYGNLIKYDLTAEGKNNLTCHLLTSSEPELLKAFKHLMNIPFRS